MIFIIITVCQMGQKFVTEVTERKMTSQIASYVKITVLNPKNY